MPYPFYLTIQLTDPGETVVDGAEYVTNGEANQHENPPKQQSYQNKVAGVFYLIILGSFPKHLTFLQGNDSTNVLKNSELGELAGAL